MLIITVFSLFFNFAYAAIGEQKYAINDLEILKEEKAYTEFFNHIYDIKPSQRGTNWQSMIDSMAISYVEKLAKNTHISADDYDKVKSISMISLLKTNGQFVQKRTPVIIKYLENMLSQQKSTVSTDIAKELVCWRDLDPSNIELNFKLGHLYLENLSTIENESIDPYIFYEFAAKSNIGDIYCKVDDLKKVLLSKLYDSFQVEKPDYPNLHLKIMSKSCWKTFQEVVKKDYLKAPLTIQSHLFNMLNSQKLITDEEIDLYSLHYLLKTPIVSDDFNYAWNKISELNTGPKRRDKLLITLDQLEAIPDNLFDSFDDVKKKVVINHIYKNFPEFFDFYAKKCINFLKGEGQYPMGNPTLNCRELFNYVEKNSLSVIDSTLIVQYKKITKI